MQGKSLSVSQISSRFLGNNVYIAQNRAQLWPWVFYFFFFQRGRKDEVNKILSLGWVSIFVLKKIWSQNASAAQGFPENLKY